MEKSKPQVFIGSSSEGIRFAHAIQANLENNVDSHQVEITVWDKVFKNGYSNLENLLQQVREKDFGIFVWSADDETRIRQENYGSVRDNLIFEFGLFLSKFGRDRVFAIVPSNRKDLRILSDLNGISLLEYDEKRAGKEDAKFSEIQSAFQVACNRIQDNIKEQGLSTKTADYTLDTILEQIKTLVERTTLTKYIGKLPDFFSTEIHDCINSANKTIHVATDFLAYGSFSAADMFEKYIKTLVAKKRKGVDVKVLILSEDKRTKVLRDQFAKDEEQWRQLNNDIKFLELKVALSTRELKPIINMDDFLNVLEEQEKDCFGKYNELHVEEINVMMPLFLWIADNKKAVFSIPTYTSSSSEYGFQTVDADLVSSLLEVWKRYRQL